MPSIKSSPQSFSPSQPQAEREVDLPLHPKFGGLGKSFDLSSGELLFTSENVFKLLSHPQTPNKVLMSGEGCDIQWSKHDLELETDVKLDQSLHKKSIPLFSKIRLGDEDGMKVFLYTIKGSKDIFVKLMSDCNIDQDISTESDVKFASVEAGEIGGKVFKFAPISKETKAKNNAIAVVDGLGLCVFSNDQWIPISGNLNGSGKAGRIGVFNADRSVTSATALIYSEKGHLGLGVDPQFALHVAEVVKFASGAILGTIDDNSPNDCFGIHDGHPAIKTKDGIFKIGTGNGNIKGKGKVGHLPVFKDEDDIEESFVTLDKESKALRSPKMFAEEIRVEKIKLGEDEIFAKNGEVFVGKEKIKLAKSYISGAITSDDFDINGTGFIQGGNIKIKARKASNDSFGVAKFGKQFRVKDGVVDLDLGMLPTATPNQAGIISPDDYVKFSNKAEKFSVGSVRGVGAIKAEGECGVIGANLTIKVSEGSHSEAGVVRLAETDFEFRNGVAFLRERQINAASIHQALDKKQDAISFCQVKSDGVGFVGDFLFNVIGTSNSVIKLNKASNSEFGIAKFSNDFSVENGVVSLNKTPLATSETHGLFSKESHAKLESLAGLTKNLVRRGCKENHIPVFEDANTVGTSPLKLNEKREVECESNLVSKSLESSSYLRVGEFEKDAGRLGNGYVRFERGALEYSYDGKWVRMSAGSVQGSGKENSLCFWKDAETLASVNAFYDEKTERLGLGTKAPLYSMHVESAGATVGIISTRASGQNNGGKLFLGSNDGSLQGHGDELGSQVFVGNGGVGARITAYASSNWDKTSSPASLVFATTQDGQSSPIEHMFLTSGGNLGLGTSKPSSPLHIASTNKHGVSAQFQGAVKIGECETSPSIVGQGVVRCTKEAVQISFGGVWRTFVLAE